MQKVCQESILVPLTSYIIYSGGVSKQGQPQVREAFIRMRSEKDEIVRVSSVSLKARSIVHFGGLHFGGSGISTFTCSEKQSSAPTSGSNVKFLKVCGRWDGAE